MTTTLKSSPSTARNHAESLFTKLRENFVNAEKIIIEIIETQAWAALGYGSFAEAWRDRMVGIRLATDGMRAHVIYALLDTESIDSVEELTGATATTIGVLRRKRALGVPADKAYVREHLRSRPGGRRGVHVFVSAEEYGEWSDIAEAAGTTIPAQAEIAIRAHFQGLAE